MIAKSRVRRKVPNVRQKMPCLCIFALELEKSIVIFDCKVLEISKIKVSCKYENP